MQAVRCGLGLQERDGWVRRAHSRGEIKGEKHLDKPLPRRRNDGVVRHLFLHSSVPPGGHGPHRKGVLLTENGFGIQETGK